MSLQLMETQDTIAVNGVLNRTNSAILSRHVSQSFRPHQNLCLNLESVTEFDHKAAYTLLKLFIKSVQANSALAIYVLQNQTVLKVLKDTEIFEILKSSKSLK